MTERPDLPSLESVEIKNSEYLVFAAVAITVVAAFMTFMVYGYLKWCRGDATLLAPIGSAFAICAGLLAWLTYRLLWSPFYWKTDVSGLTTRSLLRTRFIRWEDLISAPQIPYSKYYMSRMAILAASVWQHLRKHGKEDTIHLDEQVNRLWDTIPDEVPSEILWKNPRNVEKKVRLITYFCILLVLVGIALVVFGRSSDPKEDNAGLGWTVLLWAGVVSLIVHENRLQPTRVRLQVDTLEAQMVSRTVTLRQSDITAVLWREPGMLHLAAANKLHLVIPLDSIYDDTSMFVLSLIRWLKEGDKPIAVLIPDILRSAPPTKLAGSNTHDGYAEVRFSSSEKMAFLLYGLLLTLAFGTLVMQNQSITSIVAVISPISLVIGYVIWYLADTVRLVASDEGLTSTFLWWKSRVKWTDVGDFSFGSYAGYGAQNMTPRYTLWSKDGNRLSTLYRFWGKKEDWEQLTGVIFTQLAAVLPPEKLNKPWKARPWVQE